MSLNCELEFELRERYVLATPRALRGKVPPVLERIEAYKGYNVIGASNPDRVIVLADQKFIGQIGAKLGSELLIEPEVVYHKRASLSRLAG
jgi:hypothetical protein